MYFFEWMFVSKETAMCQRYLTFSLFMFILLQMLANIPRVTKQCIYMGFNKIGSILLSLFSLSIVTMKTIILL